MARAEGGAGTPSTGGVVMRRFAPVLAGVAGAGIVLPFLVGAGPRTAVIVVPVFAVLGLVALAGSQRAAAPESGWSGASGFIDADPTVARTVTGTRPRPSARRVAAALSRVEARELATCGWFGVGVGFLVISFLMFCVVYGSDNGGHWMEAVWLAPWLAHPLVGMVVLASHRGITRARRDNADELFDTCPTMPIMRTWGALGAAWVPVVALVLFFVAFGSTTAVRSRDVYGSLGGGAVAIVLAALVLGVGGVVLGVAVGEWVRFALAPIVAVVAVGFVSLKLAASGDPHWNPLQQLSTFPPLSSQPTVFLDQPAWSHLLWVVALTAAVAVVATARHRRDRTVAVLGAAAVLALTVTGVAATRPMPAGSARRIADLVARPAEHQTCRVSGLLQLCAYPDHGELVDRVTAELAPVAAALPGSAGTITLRQAFDDSVGDLPPEVARRLPDGVPRRPVGEVALGYKASSGDLRTTRVLVGLRAVDLPTGFGDHEPPAAIAGQARGVVALWLATRGLADDVARQLTSPRDQQHDCQIWPVTWSPQDLGAARALQVVPEATVRTALRQGWDRWKNPTTSTDELLGSLGLPLVGPFDPITDGTQNPC